MKETHTHTINVPLIDLIKDIEMCKMMVNAGTDAVLHLKLERQIPIYSG